MNTWSRRINEKDRLVYEVSDGEIVIKQCYGHYGDKLGTGKRQGDVAKPHPLERSMLCLPRLTLSTATNPRRRLRQ